MTKDRLVFLVFTLLVFSLLPDKIKTYCRRGKCRRNSKMHMYNKLADQIRRELTDRNDIKMFNCFEQDFYKNYCSNKQHITSSHSHIKVADEIKALVSAYNIDKEKGTQSYGTKTNNNFVKICISGAKGKTTKNTTVSQGSGAKEMSSLALSEMVDRTSSALVIVFAEKLGDGDFVLDAKADDENKNMVVNEDGQLVISGAKGTRFLFRKLKTIVGVTKMYRLIIGKDYIRFEINLLTAGAAIKCDRVVSKSTVRVVNFIAKEKKERVGVNVGLFTSENETDEHKGKSVHLGFLSIDQEDVKDKQKSKGVAKVASDGAEVDVFYNKFKTIIDESRKTSRG